MNGNLSSNGAIEKGFTYLLCVQIYFLRFQYVCYFCFYFGKETICNLIFFFYFAVLFNLFFFCYRIMVSSVVVQMANVWNWSKKKKKQTTAVRQDEINSFDCVGIKDKRKQWNNMKNSEPLEFSWIGDYREKRRTRLLCFSLVEVIAAFGCYRIMNKWNGKHWIADYLFVFCLNVVWSNAVRTYKKGFPSISCFCSCYFEPEYLVEYLVLLLAVWMYQIEK